MQPLLAPHPADLLERLTPKEREVLDLVVARHTSKEIARHLSLSLNTVDWRVTQARDKVGARDRNDLVRIYIELLEACGQTTSGPTPIADRRHPLLPTPPEPSGGRFTLNDAASFSLPAPWELPSTPELPEVLDTRFGKVWRVAAIPLGALSIALLVLALVTIAQVLGMLI